jgi:hypothetical protein
MLFTKSSLAPQINLSFSAEQQKTGERLTNLENELNDKQK